MNKCCRNKIYVLYLHQHLNKYSKMNVNNNSTRQQIIAMEVGDTLAFELGQRGWTTIRAYASDISFMLMRRYKTHRNRETRCVEITRVQ